MQVLSLYRESSPPRAPSFAAASGYELLDTTPFRERVSVTRRGPGDAELHTRLTLHKPRASLLVHWEVAHDARFAEVERYGLFFAHAQLDYQLRIVLSGLEPGRGYWARLWAGGNWSASVHVHTESHGHRRSLRPMLHALAPRLS